MHPSLCPVQWFSWIETCISGGMYPKVGNTCVDDVQYPVDVPNHTDELLRVMYRVGQYERFDFVKKNAR